MTVKLLLFGAPTVVHDGNTRALPFERRSQLLVYLAIKRAWVGRAEVAPLLWPDLDQALAFTNLRKTLFRLAGFKWAGEVESHGASLRYEIATDVAEFETALRERRLADALALRRGDFLEGFNDDANETWSSWLGFERDRLRAAWTAAVHERLAADIDTPAAIDLSARLIEADPYDESAVRCHIEWLTRGGQAARARQIYLEFQRKLADELGLEPSVELRALFESGSTAATSATIAPRAPVDDGFVGRTVELRRIAALLSQDDCRLLCLIGPGGMGKTRLSQRTAQELAPNYRDGTVFVSLEDVTSASDLAARLAHALRLKLSGGKEALDQIIDYLRGRQMLLVLDNFEQLTAAASLVETLLKACTSVKVIVTSRVRLGIGHEWLFPLDGLPCPEVEDEDRIEAFDAANLFVRAAHRVNPSLVASAEAAAIGDICRKVEGHPLALELAAAWTRVLSCREIAAELEQGADLLQTVDAAHPPRHGSIEAVFDQSWRLLSAVERDALSKLSVFRGGFTADEARAVAGAALPVLGALIDKSLLKKEGSRISLHPLIQQMAALRLADGAAEETTRMAHARYFQRLLAQLLSSSEDGNREALQTIDLEWENCRRAWSWAIANGQAELLRESARALLNFWDYRGRFEEGLALLRQAIDSPIGNEDPILKGQLLSKAAHLQYRLDRYAAAVADAKLSLQVIGRKHDIATRAQAVTVLGTCAFRLGRYEEARDYFKQSMEFASARQKDHSRAATLDHLALIEKYLGHYDESLRLALESLELHRKIGDTAGEALCLSNLGGLHNTRHEFETADARLREGLAICERDGIVTTKAFIYSNLTDAALYLGRRAEAEAHAQRTIETATAAGNRAVASMGRIKLAQLAHRRGDLDTARSELADGLRTALTIGMPVLKFEALDCFADILDAQGEPACARQLLTFGINHPLASKTVQEHLRTHLDQLKSPDAALPWPGLDLDELLGRVVAESTVSHAPLIAALRGQPPALHS